MTTKLLKPVLIFMFISMGAFFATASASTTDSTLTAPTSAEKPLHLITKNNNQKYMGYIISDDGREVLIETENIGRIYIPKTEILDIELISNRNSKLVTESLVAGAFSSRYILNANALPMAKGQKFAAINLYGPEVHFALTDNFSLGVITTWIVSPIMVNAVYRFTPTKPIVYYSVGTTMGASGYLNNMKTWGGYHYGNVSFGDRKSNLTIGAGVHYVFPGIENFEAPIGKVYYTRDDFSAARREVKEKPELGGAITISGITNSGSKTSFIFDSAFALFNTTMTHEVITGTGPTSFRYTNIEKNQTDGIFSLMFGMRFQRRENSAFQFSLNTVTVFGSEMGSDFNTFPIPTCSWFINF